MYFDFIEYCYAQEDRESEEEQRYHEVNDCTTRIINDPLFEVYQKFSKNDKLKESIINDVCRIRPELGFTYSDIMLFELMKNHQDASTEFIVRLANDTLPPSVDAQHKLLTQLERT